MQLLPDTMGNDKPGGIYSTHLTGATAVEIEEAAEKREITKSDAIRELIEDGVRNREGTHTTDALLHFISVPLCVGLTSAFFFAFLAAVSHPLLSTPLVGSVYVSIAITGGVPALLLATGRGEWVDRKLAGGGGHDA